jgi:hypothetical protein
MAHPKLPLVLPGGQMMLHMSAARRHQILDTAFEMVGGQEKLVHEIQRSPDSYWEFMKLWGKGLPRAVATEHTASADVESLLDKLDRAENAKVINGEVIDV